ncbi:hypothetical protein Tco_1394624 [Tanacetum coccineum]
MVNTSLKKLKHHLAGFDVVVKERTHPQAITECLKLEYELQTDFIEKEIYDKLFKSFITIEKHYISLEVDFQLNQEIFQRDNSVSNQSRSTLLLWYSHIQNDTLQQDIGLWSIIHIRNCYTISKGLLHGKDLDTTYSLLGNFCVSNLEVAFHQHTCFIRNLEGVDLLTGSQGNNLYTLSLGDMMASSPICLLLKASKTKSWLWHDVCSHLETLQEETPKPKSEDTNYDNTLIFAHGAFVDNDVAIVNGLEVHPRPFYLLIYAKALLFLWAEAVATACYTQNRSIIRIHHGKTPYQFLHDKPPDLSFFHVFGALCYPTNDSKNLVDQDAPSPSNSQTTPETQPPVIPNDVEEDNHDIEVAHMGNDPYFSIPIPEVPSDQSLFMDSIHTIVHPDHQISKHNSKWTKDHPLENIRRFDSCDLVDTPMVEKSKLVEDKEGKVVDPSHYRGMIGTLLYLTTSRPDLQFAICMYARYQTRPTKKHLHAMRLNAVVKDTRRSTLVVRQFWEIGLVSWSSKGRSVHVENGVALNFTLSNSGVSTGGTSSQSPCKEKN